MIILTIIVALVASFLKFLLQSMAVKLADVFGNKISLPILEKKNALYYFEVMYVVYNALLTRTT